MQDVIVVGSGLCGTLAAQTLSAAGASVLVLEAGPAVPRRLPGDVAAFQRLATPLAAPSPSRWRYLAPRGFEWHRARVRGGRTLLWGGWMERPPRDYFEQRARAGAPWPEAQARLEPWLRRAEQLLHVKSGRRAALHRSLDRLGWSSSTKREAVLPGQRRMLTAADLPARVRTDATALKLERTPRGLKVQLADGQQLEARRVVLAASPIETARLVEASVPPAQRRRRVPLFDHLIAGAIAIGPRQRASQHPRDAADPSAVLHPEPGSRVRFTTEVRGPTPLERLDDEDLATLGYTRAQAERHSFYVVFAMGETDPTAPRFVELDPRTRDDFGRPVPRFVKRRHTPTERRLGAQMNRRVLALAKGLCPGGAHFPLYDALEFGSGGHEVGTCLDQVDETGALLGWSGVYVADGSAVPAATDRHPSLFLAANALRVTDVVVRSLGRAKT